MEESFDPIAQTRANYYTPGSPVQFVRVELLKGSVSGDRAVCLTFKNISRVNLTALEIRFKCKTTGGEILCEDEFAYRDIDVRPGELFGMDDAVFITQKPIVSVDVVLCSVYNGNRVVRLDGIRRVRLPAPRRLPDDLAAALEERVGRKGMIYAPQVLDSGWYCACGAFHPKEEDTVYCSECGSDRILLQNALNTLMQPEQAEPDEHDEAPAGEADAPTRVAGQAGGTRAFEPVQAPRREGAAQAGQETRLFTQPPAAQPAAPAQPEPAPEATRVERTRWAPPHSEPAYEDEEDEEDDRVPVAENIIRWVPPVTALICAGIALYGFVCYQFLL